MKQVVISGTGVYVPPNVITNEELVESFNSYVKQYNHQHQDEISAGTLEALKESSSDFILKASGITKRHFLDKEGILDPDFMTPRLVERADDEPSYQCEMAVEAGKAALKMAQLDPSDIDMVIMSCSSFSRSYPAIAVEAQKFLGISGYAFDMNIACSSATFATQLAANTIQCGNAKRVLILSPELACGHVNFRDRDSHFIFGDACTALIVEDENICKMSGAFRIKDTRYKTDFSNNIRNNFGCLNRATPEAMQNLDKLFYQNGRRVFKEVIPIVVELVNNQLAELNIQPQQLQRLWLHQANINMNELISKKIMEKT